MINKLRPGLFFVNVANLLRVHARIHPHDPLFIFEGETFSYADTLARANVYARLFAARGGKVATYQANSPEYVFAYFGAAISDATLFGINTGFRGDTLHRLLEQAAPDVIMTDADHLDRLDGIDHACILMPSDPVEGPPLPRRRLRERLRPNRAFIVIYTSGTTGLPKGVVCSQLKLVGSGAVGFRRARLTRRDRGYVCMPLFHSNAWFLGVMPLLFVGGSFVLTRKFSASAFEGDVLEHGVTYLNYVGQPIHYILAALESKYGSEQAVEEALCRHPDNRLRIAMGNGAPAADRRKMIRYFNMDHIYELYGSTEAAINTCNMPGDPVDSVGEITSATVQILGDNDRPCPPGAVDGHGRLLNYDDAVGEICREIDTDNFLFEGYFENADATDSKYRDGWYRSGELGHVRVVNGKRYLFFNGRTADWIRKDGENFSAESVAEHVLAHPRVALAVAYGVPCAVSDELVMAAVQLHDGADLDPAELFSYFEQRQATGGMDPKWMPDFVRVMDALPLTPTQKVLARPLKRQHYNLDASPDMRVLFRQRGDTAFRSLTADDYAEIIEKFRRAGRQQLLD